MAKKSMKIKQARPQKYTTREYNHMDILENMEYAVFALEN